MLTVPGGPRGWSGPGAHLLGLTARRASWRSRTIEWTFTAGGSVACRLDVCRRPIIRFSQAACRAFHALTPDGMILRYSKHLLRHYGVVAAIKMLIREIEKEESNYDNHCNSHE